MYFRLCLRFGNKVIIIIEIPSSPNWRTWSDFSFSLIIREGKKMMKIILQEYINLIICNGYFMHEFRFT